MAFDPAKSEPVHIDTGLTANFPPCVSVLVTVYNREAYLAHTLRSVLASSFRDFEVVVVDDCSTDQSVVIAERIAADDDRVRVVRNERNLGDYGNRRKAALLARGTYLKYVDSDDLIYNHTLGVMVAAMEQEGNVALALSHSLPEDEQPYPWVLASADAYHKHFLGRGCFACGPTGAIIRKSTFIEVGGFRSEWGVLADIDLWLRIAATKSIALLPPGLVWWRRHPEQEFSRSGAREFYLEKGFDLALLTLGSPTCPLAYQERSKAIRRIRQHHARKLLSVAASERNPQLAWRLLRRSGLSFLELLRGFFAYQ